MSKATAPPYTVPPPYAPPSYSETFGGVAPQAPLGPQQMPPIIIQQSIPTAIVTTVVPLGNRSTHLVCPHCHAEIDTATSTSPSMMAYLSSFIICFFGCWAGCCLIPCCMDSCMNVNHTCPSCRAFLGKYTAG